MTKQITSTSGISRQQLAKVLPYPRFLDFHHVDIKNILCYIIEHYRPGLSVLIQRQVRADQTALVYADWSGNHLNMLDRSNQLVKSAYSFSDNYLLKFIALMRTIKLDQAQLFLTTDNDLSLVDLQLALNKFASPGMIKDIFGKVCPTQIVRSIEVIDERVYSCLQTGIGNYSGDLILKPSRFRTCGTDTKPFYVELKRTDA